MTYQEAYDAWVKCVEAVAAAEKAGEDTYDLKLAQKEARLERDRLAELPK